MNLFVYDNLYKFDNLYKTLYDLSKYKLKEKCIKVDPNQTQVLNVILFIILIIFSGVFSSIETAYLSVNKIRVRTLAEEGNIKAKIVEKLLSNSDRLFSSILVGNNLVNIGASSLTTAFVISVFGDTAQWVAIATGFVTLLILIFGEITPKTFATKNADAVALASARFVQFVYNIFRPIVFILNIVTGGILRLLGVDKNQSPTMTEEELKTIVTVGHEEGVLEEQEKEMIHNVFEFSETEIKEVMTPRIHVESVGDDCTFDELAELFKNVQYSRYPVHSESFDEIVGVLNVKDLFFYKGDTNNFNIKDYMRDPYVVYEFHQVSDVFASMRKEHATLAVVLDEYGVMSGIVTFEDIVEEIVGEISDEYDDIEETLVEKISDREFVIDGSISLNDVNTSLETDFNSEDFESIGGLVLGACGNMPEVGNEVVIDNVHFVVKAMHKNRIDKLHVTIQNEEIEEIEKAS